MGVSRVNTVPWEPAGLTVVLQYWAGDEVAAMRLARLLADIEPRRRDDVTLMFARRFDMEQTALAWETQLYCGRKFSIGALQSARAGEGHPAGCNELWSGAFEALAASWAAGHLRRPALFFIEADGCPLRSDWASLLIAEHQASLLSGRRVTGALTRMPAPHFNGSLIAEPSVWLDRQSLWRTPPASAWDMFHAAALLQEGCATSMIKNIYGLREASDEALRALSGETAWVCNAKDNTAIGWAERTLVAAGPMSSKAPPPCPCGLGGNRWHPEPTPTPKRGMPYTP